MLVALAAVAISGRIVLDLNSGWQFARVPTPPSIWQAPDSVPRSTWKVLRVSSEETSAEKAAAANALDGDPKTIWHSEWNKRQAPYPHSITIDLGGPTQAIGVRILPRQTSPQNGRPKEIRVYLDGQLVADSSLPDSSALAEVRFPEARGRTLRVDFISSQRPEPFLAIAEIGLIRPGHLGSDWETQYSVSRVKVGQTEWSPAQVTEIQRHETNRLADWRPAVLPHAAWKRPLDSPEIWQGVAYYRRHLPEIPARRRAVLVLQGMQSLDAWLNGKYIGSRRGGYLPARLRITAGGDLLVRVDNTDNPLIPPGKPQGQLDFMYGNGLIGNASLELTGPVRLADPLDEGGGIRIETTHLDSSAARVAVRAVATGAADSGLSVRWTIFDPDGKKQWGSLQPLKAADKGVARASAAVNHPMRWSPERPALYSLRTELLRGQAVIDRIDTAFGIRTIEVSRTKGFVLNGKPLRLIGTNRHQDYPWVGPALSDAAQWRDAMLIKRSGHNIVRLSHYNQSPAFLDACDHLGILTIPCIPGWQFLNESPVFKERVLRDIRETVKRDQNHPCVAFWETSLNETYPPSSLAKEWNDAAKAAGAELTAGDEGAGVPWDITYNGWREDLSRPSNSTKPGYIREYGDYEFGGGNSTSRVRIRDGMERLLQEAWNHVWSCNRFRPQYPSTMGMGTWEMFDHNVPWDFAVSASGLADLMRREKPSFWFFASQESTRPYLRIAADWQPGAARRTIVAFTNADSATLVVNGKKVKTQRAERGPVTAYHLDRAFDGTNTENLKHPPIVFRDVVFASGEIRVEGSNGSRDTIRTAGAPVGLRVWVDDLGIKPTPNDLVFLRAAVVDAAGTICPHVSSKITFAGADFAGQSSTACEMGVASVLVRTPPKKGTITVTATLGRLRGTCRFSTTESIRLVMATR